MITRRAFLAGVALAGVAPRAVLADADRRAPLRRFAGWAAGGPSGNPTGANLLDNSTRVQLGPAFRIRTDHPGDEGMVLLGGDARNKGADAVFGFVQLEVDGRVLGDNQEDDTDPQACCDDDGEGWGTYKFAIPGSFAYALSLQWPLALESGVHLVRFMGGNISVAHPADGWTLGSDNAAWCAFANFTNSTIRRI